MTIFYPPLEESIKYDPHFDITKPEFAKIKKDFNSCAVFHKIYVDHNFLEDPNILDWFDFVIVHPEKGVVCIKGSYICTNETNVLTNRLLSQNEKLLSNRIDFVQNLENAKIIFQQWPVNEKYQYQYDKIVDILKVSCKSIFYLR